MSLICRCHGVREDTQAGDLAFWKPESEQRARDPTASGGVDREQQTQLLVVDHLHAQRRPCQVEETGELLAPCPLLVATAVRRRNLQKGGGARVQRQLHRRGEQN